jgi:hypothetical protein
MTLAPVLLLSIAVAAASHPVAFWRAIAASKYELPAGEQASTLASELVDLLASPDPELRDEIAYSTLANWIYERKSLDAEAVRGVAERLTGNLKAGIGEQGTDAVFRRSFSALTLAAVIARDNAEPFLRKDEVAATLTAALQYLAAERDVRGYDQQRGWMHSAAHTADLLRFLARSRHLDPADQPRILDAITAKFAGAGTVFTHGEDERMARAVLSIVNRADFDRDAFRGWTVRTRPARLNTASPTPSQLAGVQNAKNLLAKLEVILASVPEPTEAIGSARESVREALKGLF